MNKSAKDPVSALQPRQRKMKLALLLVGLVFGALVFLTLDLLRTASEAVLIQSFPSWFYSTKRTLGVSGRVASLPF